MKAMVLKQMGRLADNEEPLELVHLPKPSPRDHQVLIKISVCGVCHTELDEIEGRTPPSQLPMVPGHQIIGTVVEVGSGVSRHQLGDRVGVGWIFSSDGSRDENLSDDFLATGRDQQGGYAEFMTAHENYAYPIPRVFTDRQAAPLMCAGSIGYRALRLTGLQNGQPLGLTGFGGSGHLVIQLARHQFPDSAVYVFARDPQEREFALELGAVWAGDTEERSPLKLSAIIDTTPVWTPVIAAMNNLAPGGRLVINAIRKQDSDKSALLGLDYEQHLWMERELKTVANIAGHDIAEFLPIAASIPLQPDVELYPLEAANTALMELKRGSIRGSKVLSIGD